MNYGIVASLVQGAFIFFPELFELAPDALLSLNGFVSTSIILLHIYDTAI